MYTNGPINGTINAWTINFGFAVEDLFTLSTTTTVTGVTFGGWTDPGDVITSVDWGIAATPDSFADDGTAAVTTRPYFGQSYGYDIYTYSFSISPTSLAAGTYYLTLQNAVATNGDPAYWDENDGPSTALENTVGSIGSEVLLGDFRRCSRTVALGDDAARLRGPRLHGVSPGQSGPRRRVAPNEHRLTVIRRVPVCHQHIDRERRGRAG